jgi:YVTN family beta-propeller protein
MRRVLGVAVVTVVALVWGSAIGGAAPSKHALPTAGKVVASIPIPPSYGGLAVGEHAVWALTDDVSRLSRIDPAKNAVTARITVKPASPCPEFVCGEPAEGEGALWVPRASDNAVFRLDPSSNRVVAKIPVGAHPTAVALTPDAVWVANGGGERNGRIEGPSISRVDPATNAVVATIELGPADIASFNTSLAAGAGSVWAGVAGLHAVVRIDPATNGIVAKIHVSLLPCAQLAVDERGVWASTGNCAPVAGIARIDPRTNRQTRTVKGELAPIGLALGFGSLWVADLNRQAVDRIDPRTGRITGRLPVGGKPVRIGVGFGSVWVRSDTGRVLRIKPAR